MAGNPLSKLFRRSALIRGRSSTPSAPGSSESAFGRLLGMLRHNTAVAGGVPQTGFGSPTNDSFADRAPSPDIREIEPAPYEVPVVVRREANTPSLTLQALQARLFRTQGTIRVRLALPGSDVGISLVVETRFRYVTIGELQATLYTALYAPPPAVLVSAPYPAAIEAFRKRIGQLDGEGLPSLIDFYPPNHADDRYLVLMMKPLDGQLGEATEYEVAWSNAHPNPRLVPQEWF